MNLTRPTAIELFCGAGGTSVGFEQAGFDVRVGLDFDPAATATFQQNHPNAVAITENVEKASGKELLKAAKLEEVNVLLGGPSCQGYSTHGKRIQDDPRNFLFTEYTRLVGEIRPKWLVFENVRGMLYYGKGKFLQKLKAELEKLGYKITYSILNAADYGVPQRRERLIIIGSRVGVEPSLPRATHHDPRCTQCSRPDRSNKIRGPGGLLPGMEVCTHCDGTGQEPTDNLETKPWVSLWEAIGDLPTIGDVGGTDDFVPYEREPFSEYQRRMREGAQGYDMHSAKKVSSLAFEIISKIPEGKGLRAIPPSEMPARFKQMRTVKNGSLRKDCTTLYYRLERGLPSYTITCYFKNVSSGAFTHPLANRAITVREAARLQSFPDWFRFSPNSVPRQIGNAVPPVLAEALGRHILSLMADKNVTRSRKKVSSKEAELQDAYVAGNIITTSAPDS